MRKQNGGRTEEENNRAKLLQKIFAVMVAIPVLEKTGEMKEGDEVQYKYHEADGIRGPLRDQLINNRLLLLPTNIDCAHFVNPTSTGGNFNYSEQLITFTWFDIDTGESLDCQAVGWGGDSLDKAAPKASIQALKYFTTNGLHICGLELDGDSAEEQIAGREANKQHMYITGVPDVCISDLEYPWALIDGVRLFSPGRRNKITSMLKKIETAEPRPTVKMRYFLGKNGTEELHPVIDKIEIMQATEPGTVPPDNPTY